MLSPGSVIPSSTTVNICLPCVSWNTLDTWCGPHSRTAGWSQKLMISWSQFWDRLAVQKVDRQAVPQTVCGTAWRSTFWTARRSQNKDHELLDLKP